MYIWTKWPYLSLSNNHRPLVLRNRFLFNVSIMYLITSDFATTCVFFLSRVSGFYIFDTVDIDVSATSLSLYLLLFNVITPACGSVNFGLVKSNMIFPAKPPMRKFPINFVQTHDFSIMRLLTWTISSKNLCSNCQYNPTPKSFNLWMKLWQTGSVLKFKLKHWSNIQHFYYRILTS